MELVERMQVLEREMELRKQEYWNAMNRIDGLESAFVNCQNSLKEVVAVLQNNLRLNIPINNYQPQPQNLANPPYPSYSPYSQPAANPQPSPCHVPHPQNYYQNPFQFLGTPTDFQHPYHSYQYFTHKIQLLAHENPAQSSYVLIETQHGKIFFNEIVNITNIQLPLNQWLDITENDVNVHVDELRGKRFEVFFYDFMGYAARGDQGKREVMDVVHRAQQNQRFQYVDFNMVTGQLFVKCYGQ